MAFTPEGRAALVTGSGRGIGRAIAERLAEAGAAVKEAAGAVLFFCSPLSAYGLHF